MHILITGIAGFGGGGLAKELLNRGHNVSGLDIIAPLQSGLGNVKSLFGVVMLDGKTPAEVSGIKILGENKWFTLIQNANRTTTKS